MKKILIVFTIVLAISLVLPVLPVSADGFDLSKKSTEELLALRTEIDEEIGQRIGTIAPIYGGVYIVGRDIKAGKYVIHAQKATDEYGISMLVARLDKEASDLDSLSAIANAATEEIIKTDLEEGEKLMFTLSDGMVLLLNDVDTAYLQIVENPIWAP